MYEIGRFGSCTKWLTTENTRIKLHKNRLQLKHLEWNYDDKIYTDKFNLRSELNISEVPTPLTIFEKSGIEEGLNPNSYWISKIKKIIATTQKYKSTLDLNMYLGICTLPQEVFIFKEDRPNRVILELDLVSAFTSALTLPIFPNPSELRFTGNKEDVQRYWMEDNYTGLFKVKLRLKKNAPSWFRGHHPFYWKWNTYTYPFYFESTIEITTFIHKIEKDEVSKYLEIEPIECVAGPVMEYPLKTIVSDLLNKKDNASSLIEKAQIKWLLNRMLSATTINHYKYMSEHDASIHFQNLGIEPINKTTQYKVYNGWKIKNIYNTQAIYTWLSTCTGKIRSEWIKLVGVLKNSNYDIDICYANIDSVHISVASKDLQHIIILLDKEKLTGDVAGKWKINTKGSSGLWFAPNIYWIYEDKKLKKSTKNQEKWKTKTYTIRLLNDKLLKTTNRLWQSIDSRKKLKFIKKGYITLNRYSIDKISNAHTLIATLKKEALHSRNWKKKIWYETRRKYV